MIRPVFFFGCWAGGIRAAGRRPAGRRTGEWGLLAVRAGLLGLRVAVARLRGLLLRRHALGGLLRVPVTGLPLRLALWRRAAVGARLLAVRAGLALGLLSVVRARLVEAHLRIPLFVKLMRSYAFRTS